MKNLRLLESPDNWELGVRFLQIQAIWAVSLLTAIVHVYWKCLSLNSFNIANQQRELCAGSTNAERHLQANSAVFDCPARTVSL